MLSGDMAREHNDGGRASATESHVSLTAGVVTAFDASRFGRIWTSLFGLCAGAPE
jgi:hypothetical protein